MIHPAAAAEDDHGSRDQLAWPPRSTVPTDGSAWQVWVGSLRYSRLPTRRAPGLSRRRVSADRVGRLERPVDSVARLGPPPLAGPIRTRAYAMTIL